MHATRLDITLPGPTSTGSFIGIAVAISGNVLISLALNLQKLAHRKLQSQLKDGKGKTRNDIEAAPEETHGEDSRYHDNVIPNAPPPPLQMDGKAPHFNVIDLSTPTSSPKAPRIVLSRSESQTSSRPRKPSLITPSIAEEQWADTSAVSKQLPLQPENGITEQTANAAADTDEESPRERTSSYLRSKLWWAGLVLMSVGEAGNFLSYAYAPASVVAPLGTFALIANCLFAPLLVGEKFRKRDFFGVALAIIGAVTVVISSKASDIHLSPDALIHAIGQKPFVAYSVIYVAAALSLTFLSNRSAGEKYVIVDVGLCALFGGFTVLATKGFSSMLSLIWLKVFTEWITYPVLLVLLGTAVGQIKYLNRALMKFDSKVVVPIQFVLFNLSAIIGSAVLYREFDDVDYHTIITFLYGCATTFAGVFCLTYRPSSFFSAPSSDNQSPEETTSLVITTPLPVLRTQQSAASLGLSPGKYLLIATSSDDSPVAAVHVPTSGGGIRRMSTTGVTRNSGRPRPVWKPASVT